MPSTLSTLTYVTSPHPSPSATWLHWLFSKNQRKYHLIVTLLTSIFLGSLIVLFKWKWKSRSKKKQNQNQQQGERSTSNPREFLEQMRFLLGIMFPQLFCKQSLILIVHTATLILRTLLSIFVAKLEGSIVSQIVQRNIFKFIRLLGTWLLIGVPACLCNSAIRYLEQNLALSLRIQLSSNLYSKYFQSEDKLFYRCGNLDLRLPNADHALTEDLRDFTGTLAHLYSRITKPLLDTLLISGALLQRSKGKGYLGPSITVGVILVTFQLLKSVTPNFSKMVSEEAEHRARVRMCHSRVSTNSEEIAFLQGSKVEWKIVEREFRQEIQSSSRLYRTRLFYIFLEQFLMKYVWAGSGMVVTAIPILSTVTAMTSDPSTFSSEASRTEYYMTTKNLLASGADAIERLMGSYKEIAELAGYASRVAKIFKVFQEVKEGHYERGESCSKKENLPKLQIAQVEVAVVENGDSSSKDSTIMIELRKIQIVTPNGDVIVPELDLVIRKGMHVLITGPNGCGKSSLFRILSGLWPVYGEFLRRPPINRLFYIPQRPYMSLGNLRDQVIYPDDLDTMTLTKGLSDAYLSEILEKVGLNHLVAREGGWDSVKDWQDVLSGGEKQRMGVARLFYHRPNFALLDECTSAVSIDVEDSIYKMLIEQGITLLTITHRPSLFKHHTHILRFAGDGTWSFGVIN